MEIIKNDGLEQAKLEKFKIIKNGQNPLEFDFKFHLVTGINAFVEPKIDRSTAKDYFDNHILKGFVYNTYIINDIDYVAIKTANDSKNLPSHIMLLPIMFIDIVKVYKEGEGPSIDYDFNVNLEDKRIGTIDKWVKSKIRGGEQIVSFKLHYDTTIEKKFMLNSISKYFEDDTLEFDWNVTKPSRKKHVLHVLKAYTTYHNFLKFLFSSPLIYLNMEVNCGNLKKQLKYDFENIIKSFGDDEFIILGFDGFTR